VFLQSVRIEIGANPASYSIYNEEGGGGFFISGCDKKLTIHLYLIPLLKMNTAIPPTPNPMPSYSAQGQVYLLVTYGFFKPRATELKHI
jgi:hypothetical protein